MDKKHDEINPDDRFKIMEKIHRQYFPLFLSICRENNFSQSVKQMVEDFVIGRIGAQKGVRAFIFYELYKLAGGNENIDFLLAAVELHLASMYCFNVAADAKAGYDTSDKKIIAYQTQNEVFNLSLKAIDKFTNNIDLNNRIKEIFAKTQRQFQEGEVLDTLVNLYKNKGKFSNDILKEIEKKSDSKIYNDYGFSKEVIANTIKKISNLQITDLTFDRTYGINAAMLENFGSIIGVILELDNKTILKLKNFGKYYGIGMMIVNDVQDYSLDLIDDGNDFATREKNKNDVFNDLRKGKITWPIKYALEIDSGLDDLFSSNLGNEMISYDDCDKIRLLLLKNGAIKRCILESTHYEKLANDSIKDFGNEDEKHILFQATTTMMRLSKYIYVLEDKYKVILKPTKSEIKKIMHNL